MASFQDLAKQLHVKSKEFNEHLTGLLKLNGEFRDQAGRILTAITKLCGHTNGVTTCKVCYTRPGQFACVPCYHGGLCESCSAKSQERGRCFVCRARVEDIVKIFS